MSPVLRVIIPTVSLTETARDLGGEAHVLIGRGDNTDYITDDARGNKAVPASALYAARMDATGKVTVVRGKNELLTPDHTFLGWPIPE